MQTEYFKNGQKYYFSAGEYLLGNIYTQMIQSETPKNFKVIDKNIGYLMKTIPFAAKKAKSHYREAIKTAQEIGAKGFLGQSYLALVFLYNLKKRNDEARHYFLETISIFEDCEAYVFLEKAKKGLESLS